MLRLGSPSSETREMDLDDIFHSRLKLMIIMAKAYMNGYPLGEHRRRAMLENARHVESESIDLDSTVGGLQSQPHSCVDYDHVFYQRVKLLAVMVKAVAKGFPMGEHRIAAMHENLDSICQTLMFNSQPEDLAFLKVA
ncbi:MAG: hypothetical protein VR64_05025 [Desulfatitalea sp. BRH_c12]|nr:MAG: hypothetical protein VR64_05025 [Desulfatitalea sp. BRH_c12]